MHFLRLLYLHLSMIKFLNQAKRLTYCTDNLLKLSSRRFTITTRPFYRNYSYLSALHVRSLPLGFNQFRLVLSRNVSRDKKKGRNYVEEESSDEEDEFEEEEDEQYGDSGNVKTYRVKSLRVGSVLKTALGISNKKVEEYFYQNKLRVNGGVIHKKSQRAYVNDEIDLIIGFAKNSPGQLNVNRVTLLKAKADPDNENFIIKVLREKSLRISNYTDGNHWKEPEEENL